MAKSEKRSLNPAAAKLKADKAAARAKQVKDRARQRQEKYARQNPLRIQQRIDEIRRRETEAGSLSLSDKDTLERLEKELQLVTKARKAKGLSNEETALTVKRNKNPGSIEPQKRDVHGYHSDSGESTSSSVADIPLPSDNIFEQKLPQGWRPHAANPTTNLAITNKPQSTTYEAAPIMRDLKKEVTSFIPSTVKTRKHV